MDGVEDDGKEIPLELLQCVDDEVVHILVNEREDRKVAVEIGGDDDNMDDDDDDVGGGDT